MSSSIVQITIIVVYVLIMIGVGYWSMRRTRSVGDFFLGGRNLGPWMSAFAYGTTYFSAVIFIGYAGKLGWGFGIHTMWIVAGNTLIGSFLAWKLLAGRTREMTARLNALTMPEFLNARYGSRAMQVIGALVIFIFLVPYSASVYMGLSYLFEKALGMQYNEALFLLAAITGVYLVMGGYLAVAVSDFIRGIVEFAAVMIMVYILASWKGGFLATASALSGSPDIMAPGLAKVTALGPAGFQLLVPGSLILLSLVLITSFGPMALPQMVQKFYSIRSRADVRRAMTVAGVFALFMTFGAYYSGALTHLFYINGLPQEIMAGGKPNLDQLMPVFITTVFPYGFVLLFLLLIFSASMSSLSSLVLVSSSAIAIDFYGAFVDRSKNQKRTMLLMRVLCAVFVALSLIIAMSRVDVIVNLMVMSWGALAGVFMAPYLYGLFWKRATRAGAWAGIIAGLTAAFSLFMLWGKDGIPLAGAITMFLPMIVVPVVSLMTEAPPRELIERAFHDPQENTEIVGKKEYKKAVHG
jgi:solute:Na+ symporter, SSS family